MQVAIIGAGHTGLALAAFLFEKKVPFLIYTRSAAKQELWDEFPVRAEGAIESTFKAASTTDLAKAASFADVFVISTPATAHEDILSSLIPLAKKNARFLFLNGCWAALKGLRCLQKKNIHGMVMAETANQPFLASLSPDFRIVSVKAVKSEIAYYSSSDDPVISSLLHTLSPKVTKVSSPAATSLSQTNPIIHAAASLFNMTRIENEEDFLFFGRPMTKRVISFIEAADAERIRIAKALGLSVSSLLDTLNASWDDKKETLAEALKENPSYQSVKGPKSLSFRYLTEDIPCGIEAMADLAEMLHVDAPRITLLADMAALYLDMPRTPFLTPKELRLLKQLSDASYAQR